LWYDERSRKRIKEWFHCTSTLVLVQEVAMDEIPLVVALDAPAATREQVGGKGASLARLAAAGLPVPPGFHVTTAAYRRFVAEHGLQAQILAAVSAVRVDQPATLDAASQHIAGLFAQHLIPDAIVAPIRQAYADLGRLDLPVAVRSSATAEDLPELSFAGQQETYLNMYGSAMVLEAVKRCWASLWTARAIGYRTRHGVAPEDVSLAVVVQELVPAEAAGILFTANPLTGARGEMLINAAWGLGEAIVGGHVTPDTIVVDRQSGTITEQQISTKDVMTVRSSDGTREEPVPDARRTRSVLEPAQAAELTRIGVQIEELYGRPMDIEWALHADRIFIVQARPITALPQGAAAQATQAAAWKLPNPKARYLRTSVFELLPDPLSPLFATLGLPAWTRATASLAERLGMADLFPNEIAQAMEGDARLSTTINGYDSSGFPDAGAEAPKAFELTTINGYGYYGYSLKPAQTGKLLLALPHFIRVVPGLLRSSQRRWQEARSRYAAVVKRWQTVNLTSASAADLLHGAGEITAEAAQHYLAVQSGILPAAYMSESLFTLVYTRMLKRRTDPAALTFLLGFDSAPIQAEKSLYDLARWASGQPELATALAGMSSEQFTRAYREHAARAAEGVWPEFWRRLADHLARFGHSIYDLDFAKAVLADDPLPVVETLRFFMIGQAPDPYARQAAAAAARDQATHTMFTRLRGLRLSLFWRLVRLAQAFAPLREDALAEVGLGWPVLRRLLHELGQRLVTGSAITSSDDVFWLALSELQATAAALDAGQAAPNARTVIAERRATWERQCALTPPAALPKGGARFLGIDWMPARTEQTAGNTVKGIGASPGRVIGVARVIHGPNEFSQMQQGDILVAKITTPAWTPLFTLASGVVTDVGGPLSHSSIVAREYHIPAVLGCGVATERLHTGQRVTVDGDAGTVTISSS
jgi:rifampicin phosphotransferase